MVQPLLSAEETKILWYFKLHPVDLGQLKTGSCCSVICRIAFGFAKMYHLLLEPSDSFQCRLQFLIVRMTIPPYDFDDTSQTALATSLPIFYQRLNALAERSRASRPAESLKYFRKRRTMYARRQVSFVIECRQRD